MNFYSIQERTNIIFNRFLSQDKELLLENQQYRLFDIELSSSIATDEESLGNFLDFIRQIQDGRSLKL